jgi:hypothetical protein
MNTDTNNIIDNQNKSEPGQDSWRRNPIVWMIIAIPLSSVLVGFVMLWFAITTFDGLVVDDYSQHGKEINLTLARDALAVSHGIQARLELLPQSGILKLRLSLTKQLPLTDTLALNFIHRTRAGEDISITLQKSANGEYIAPLPALKPANWIVQLETSEWRITGQAPVPGSKIINLGVQS